MNRATRRAMERQQRKAPVQKEDALLRELGAHLGNCKQVVQALDQASKAYDEAGTDEQQDAHKERYLAARREEIEAWDAFVSRLEQIRDGEAD